jgi:hypothetical protein
LEAYERITGEPFDDYFVRAGVTPRNGDVTPDDAALERLREGHG